VRAVSGRITDAEILQLRNHGPALLALAEKHIKTGKLKKHGDEYEGCCPFHDDKNPSFFINAKDGRFFCHGCDAKGDTIGFARKAEGLDFIKACELVAQTAGIQLEKDRKAKNGNGHAKAADWEPLVPPPRDVAAPASFRDSHLGEPAATYEYVSAEGRLLYYIRRFEPAGARKQIRPLTYGVLKGQRGWHNRHPNAPRPLFRLDAIAQAGDRTILLVEGEKAVLGAERLFPDHVATTWPGGAKGTGHADFGPLGDGANVILWPDADQEGLDAMAAILRTLPQARIVNVDGLPEGFDAADLSVDDPEAWLRERIETPETPETEHELPPIYWEDQRVSDWAGRHVPEMEWIVPGWIPAEQLTGLYGVGGINKTDFMLQLLMAKSRGLPFIGFQLEPSPVYGLFCEDTREQIIRRIDRIALHYGLSREDFPDLHFVSLVGYDEPEFMIFDQNRKDPVTDALKYVDKKVKDTGSRLVTLDMGDHFFGGDELRKRDIIRFVRKLDGVSTVRKFGMVMSRHPSQRGRKEGGRQESGNSGWEGCMRARLGLDIDRTEKEEVGANPYRPEPVGEGRTLILWKSNYSQAGITLDLICKNGVFTTIALDPERAKQRGINANAACEEKFLELLAEHFARGVYLHMTVQVHASYAPLVFSIVSNHAFSVPEFKRAMNRLLGNGRIKQESYGPPSRARNRLVIVSSEQK
jgi:hypothetical protein